MKATNVKESDYLTAWAIFFVLSFIGGTVAGAVVGGIAGGILGAVGASRGIITTVAGGLGFLVGLPISYVCFRFAVTKILLPKLTAPVAAVEPLRAAA